MMEWNTIKYIDCMDGKEGLPSLPDKSIDLCITDPPFNVNLLPSKHTTNPHHRDINPNALPYNDKNEKYKEWCQEWFYQLKRITNGIVIHCGEKNIPMWCKIEEPKGFAWHYIPNSWVRSRIAHRLLVSPIIIYGKTKRMKNNFFNYIVNNGFLSQRKFKHPCALSEDFWEDLINRLKPNSVIDPFMGTGTTAEVCTKLGIPWIGYEIMKEYSVDIDKRLKNCKREPKQVNLEVYSK